jgi:hypothetical protein
MTILQIKTEEEIKLIDRIGKCAEESPFTMVDILNNFSVYTPRQTVARFLNRYEMFKKILKVHGSVMEFGVYKGAGAFSWLHFSSILEPYNISRKIFAFDTFTGFPDISDKDSPSNSKGDLNDTSYDELVKIAAIQQENIAVNHIPRLKFIKGDICETLPMFLEKNPHVIAALVYIDVDIYKPTKAILEMIIRRVPKGGIIAFDELNDERDQGETIALLEEININNYQIKRNYFDSFPCYMII